MQPDNFSSPWLGKLLNIELWGFILISAIESCPWLLTHWMDTLFDCLEMNNIILFFPALLITLASQVFIIFFW